MNHSLFKKIVLFLICSLYNILYVNKLYGNDNNNLTYINPKITIAIVVPLTGKYANYGKDLLIAAHQAMHEYAKINPSVNIQKIQLIPYDNQCNSNMAVNIAYKIIKDHKIKIIIEHNCTNSAAITSKIYAKKGILHIIPTSSDHTLTEQGFTTLFRMCGRNDIQAQQISKFISKKFAKKNIAILHNDDQTSKLMAEQVQESLAILKIAPKLYQSINADKFNTHVKIVNFIKKLKKLQINVIFFSGFYKETANLLKIIYNYKINISFITIGNILTPEFFKILPHPKINSGTMMSFDKMDLSHCTFQPNQSIFGYMAMQVILNTIDAINHINITNNYNRFNSLANHNHSHNNNHNDDNNYAIERINGMILANWLHHNKVTTILGEKSWDTNGEIIDAEFDMYIWDDKGSYWKLNTNN